MSLSLGSPTPENPVMITQQTCSERSVAEEWAVCPAGWCRTRGSWVEQRLLGKLRTMPVMCGHEVITPPLEPGAIWSGLTSPAKLQRLMDCSAALAGSSGLNSNRRTGENTPDFQGSENSVQNKEP